MGKRIVVDQFVGSSWADVYVVDGENETVEIEQGLELEVAYSTIRRFKEGYHIESATHVIYNGNEEQVSKRVMELGEF